MRVLGATAVLLAILGTAALAQEPGRAERLAQLRSDVEALQHEVTMEKGDMRARLRALEDARTQLELQIKQEELSLQQLSLQIDKERALAAEEGEATNILVPAVQKGIAAMRPVIETGIPYRTGERLQALRELEVALNGGTLPPARAANRLWSLYEDELRLTRENAMDRQTISLNGEEVLVDVARMGMVALYFRTPDGRAGWATRSGTTWGFQVAEDRADVARIDELFDALGKQIRVGWFEVPNVLPEVQ